VISAVARENGTQLLVAPVTHAQPEHGGEAMEIPAIVKKQLGLDVERSWIVLTELNLFIWPGPDVRIAPGHPSPVYDAIPDWLFLELKEAILRRSRAGRLRVTKRTE
jgi:hypothetical protein